MSDSVNRSRERARRLRRDSTIPEQLLWRQLRSRQLSHLKFRRQHPIGRYIVDFYCAAHALVIELDGKSHDDTFEYDRKRAEWIESQGLRILRFDNDQVLQDADFVLEAILIAVGINPDMAPTSPSSNQELGPSKADFRVDMRS